MSHEKTEYATHRDGMDETSEERALIGFVTTKLLEGREVTITATTPLFEDRLIDSMNILKLIGYIESKLGGRLDDKEIVMAKFRTVRTMVESYLQ